MACVRTVTLVFRDAFVVGHDYPKHVIAFVMVVEQKLEQVFNTARAKL